MRDARAFGGVLITALLSSSSLAKTRDLVELQPSTPWVVDYADDSCRLTRAFGTGDEQVILIMDQFEPSDWFNLIFAGDRFVIHRSWGPSKARIRFGPSEVDADAAGLPAEVGEKRAFVVLSSQRIAPSAGAEASALAKMPRGAIEAPIGEARERSAKWLDLKDLLRHDLRLETGPMHRAMAALRACAWDAVRSWGLDVEQQKTRSRKPFPTSSAWFRSEEYPGRMLSGGYQGKINFRVMVDGSGAVESCHIQESTRPKEFDDVVCRSVSRRAKFEPALDAEGRPIRSFWRQTVTYRIGG